VAKVPESVVQFDAMIMWFDISDIKNEIEETFELNAAQRSDKPLLKAQLELMQAVGAFQSEVESYCDRLGVASNDPRWAEIDDALRGKT
jgi:hypothetical protein